MINMCNMMGRRLVNSSVRHIVFTGNSWPTGDGRWRRVAASRSPGDSKVTTGSPKVMPTRLAKAPPRECPITQILEWGLDSISHYLNHGTELSNLLHVSDVVVQVLLKEGKAKHRRQVSDVLTVPIG